MDSTTFTSFNQSKAFQKLTQFILALNDAFKTFDPTEFRKVNSKEFDNVFLVLQNYK